MCMGSGQCGSWENLAYLVSKCLMFSSEVGRVMQKDFAVKIMQFVIMY